MFNLYDQTLRPRGRYVLFDNLLGPNASAAQWWQAPFNGSCGPGSIPGGGVFKCSTSVQRAFTWARRPHARRTNKHTLIYHRVLHHSFLMTRLEPAQKLRAVDTSLLYTRAKPRRRWRPTYQAGSATWPTTYKADRQSSFSNCALPYSWSASPSNGRWVSNALVSYVSITKRPSPLR